MPLHDPNSRPCLTFLYFVMFLMFVERCSLVFTFARAVVMFLLVATCSGSFVVGSLTILFS